MSETFYGGIQAAADAAVKAVTDWLPTDLKVMPEKQYTNTDPNRIYACWFTSIHMYFKTTAGLALSWADYKTACVNAGGMTADFMLKDSADKISLMAKAAGVNACLRTVTDNIALKIAALIHSGKPVVISLNGEHYELVVSYDPASETFGLADPGFQNDTLLRVADLVVYHAGASGTPIYSKGHNGGPRHVTRIFWYE